MSKIRVLRDDVIGKIAAGEVVERPAAAIKELVENSLDASATAVTVEIRDGGISYIRVTDNGSGIEQSDIRMAFERHATSKITDERDLNAISTLGFRGEALASIAAVSRVTCTTRTAGQDSGVQVKNCGGIIENVSEAACPDGTTFIVRDLFYNQPVRLKFLKRPATEAGYVSDLMMRLILSRPDVCFRLINDGKVIYHSAGDGSMESAVYSIYGNEMLRTMRKIDGNMNGVIVQGYVGIGESGRGNRNNQSFFINHRYMQSKLLSTAVEEACRERVMIGKYPVCVLHVTMPYDSVDVNVHPNKLEVRFQNEAAVAEAVETIVRDGIAERDILQRPVVMQITPEPKNVPKAIVTKTIQSMPPELPAEISKRIEAKSADSKTTAAEPVQHAPVPSEKLRENAPTIAAYTMQNISANPPPVIDVKNVQTEMFNVISAEQVQKPLKLIGVLFNTYILLEYDDHLLMIDQHAAHERILYEKMMKAYDQHECAQELLIPMIVSVTRNEQEVLAENQNLLESIGFTVEPFGDSEVSIRSIPMILGEPQTKEFLHEVLDRLLGEQRQFALDKRRNAILQTACKHAVKGGEMLTEDTMRKLVSMLIDQKVTPTCPHGRPLVVAISRYELDKKFKRIQS